MSEQGLHIEDIDAWLAEYQEKELLRFVAVGSVDDGKSTLIGRLLHDTGMVYEDQLEAARRASRMPDGSVDFSLLTDGLAAEREQGITIDVAYRYFSTDKRKFIIADTPGHAQYTRNMVTGASTADVALILIDARLGVLEQSRRHATIASLLGIPHLAVCVNKMDLVSWDQAVFERIRDDFSAFAADLAFKDVTFIPVSATRGSNIVEPSTRMPWCDGETVLGYLERVPVSADRNLTDLRFPVQYVIRPDLNYRGYAGEVVSGTARVGQEVMVLPGGQRTRVEAIDTYDGPLKTAETPRSVVLRLEDEVDVSRGDMLVDAARLPRVRRRFEAHLVWMSARPLDVQKTYLLKHTTQMVRAQIGRVAWKKDMETLAEVPAEGLSLNDIGRVEVTCHRALYFDPYRANRATGAFIVIDSLTNDTVGAGMIVDGEVAQGIDEVVQELHAGSALQPKSQVSPRERFERLGQEGCVVWLTGLPGSGKWPLAYALERRLFDLGHTATVVVPTGEDLRTMISAAKAGADAGLITICAFAAYGQADRHAVRARVGGDRFVHVYVNTSEARCRERRPNADFSRFEAPTKPVVTVSLDDMNLDVAIEAITDSLARRGHFEAG